MVVEFVRQLILPSEARSATLCASNFMPPAGFVWLALKSPPRSACVRTAPLITDEEIWSCHWLDAKKNVFLLRLVL
jgi:hypothetical protein